MNLLSIFFCSIDISHIFCALIYVIEYLVTGNILIVLQHLTVIVEGLSKYVLYVVDASEICKDKQLCFTGHREFEGALLEAGI